MVNRLRFFAFGLLLATFLTSFSYEAATPSIVMLQVFVVDDSGNVQPNAQVKIFESEADFDAQKKPFATETTNKKGKAIIKGLQEKVYYVYAKKGKKDNAGGASKTEKLDKNRVNKINIIVSSGPALPGY